MACVERLDTGVVRLHLPSTRMSHHRKVLTKDRLHVDRGRRTRGVEDEERVHFGPGNLARPENRCVDPNRARVDRGPVRRQRRPLPLAAHPREPHPGPEHNRWGHDRSQRPNRNAESQCVKIGTFHVIVVREVQAVRRPQVGRRIAVHGGPVNGTRTARVAPRRPVPRLAVAKRRETASHHVGERHLRDLMADMDTSRR